CRVRGLRVGGTKAQLVERLSGPDPAAAPWPPSSPPLPHVRTLCWPTAASSTPAGPEGSLAADEDLAGALESSYQKAINGEPGGSGEEDGEEDEDGDGGEDRQEDEDVGSMEHRAAADDDMAWVDTFILNTRRTGGRQTETSVLKMYKASNCCALRAGVVLDAVVDANHKIHYLKYATTHCLLTKGGKEKETDECLSAQSLKKIVTMLGRILRQQQDSNPDLVQDRPASNYRCQDYIKSVMVEARRLRIQSANFDVTKGTILEYELHPEQFMEVTAAIFDMDQGTSVFCTCTSPSDLRPSRLSSVHHQVTLRLELAVGNTQPW
ncbi:hypothetical protein EDB92DRAFT_1804851, partial [Lactarius akahatsu]